MKNKLNKSHRKKGRGSIENWKPLKVPEIDDHPGIEPGSDELGYFKIDENDEYYILDGQHRVASILSIINPESLFLEYLYVFFVHNLNLMLNTYMFLLNRVLNV